MHNGYQITEYLSEVIITSVGKWYLTRTRTASRGTPSCRKLGAMTLPIMLAAATILVSLGVLFLVRHFGSDPVLPVTTEWLSELSTERYRPMRRLLDEAEFRFLVSQDGCTAEMAKRLRRERVAAFRGYLRMLEADFERVAAALRLMLTYSAEDRPELAFLLLQRRSMFVIALMVVHCRLVLFRCGLSGVDVTGLIQLFDGLRRELRTLVPACSPALA